MQSKRKKGLFHPDYSCLCFNHKIKKNFSIETWKFRDERLMISPEKHPKLRLKIFVP
uniref:Uncharacterized protein n=1 Tax=Tetranychus urticae TaxID=32264 RepID=T1K1N0_TETUR